MVYSALRGHTEELFLSSITFQFFNTHNTGIWMASSPMPSIPSPSNFGWMMEEGIWKPLWITIPEVSKCTKELIKCKYTGGCTSCLCAKAVLYCANVPVQSETDNL